MSDDRELRDLVERLQTENAQLRKEAEGAEALREEARRLAAEVERLWQQLELADENRAKRDVDLDEERGLTIELHRDLEIAQQEMARLRNLLDSARLELELFKKKSRS